MKLNLYLAKIFQFITFLLFTFMVLVYFGFMVILPLDVLAQTIRLLTAIGLPTLLAAVGGVSVLTYLGLNIYRHPQIYTLVLNIGRDLVIFGQDQIRRYDPMIAAAQVGEESNLVATTQPKQKSSPA
jgi:hypothetical protein